MILSILSSSFSLLNHSFTNTHLDWNILKTEQIKEIANKAPTDRNELADCMLPEHFQKEYGDRLLKNINAYIKSEKLQEIIEARPKKKSKRDVASESKTLEIFDDEFDDGIDYAAIEMPVTQASGKNMASLSDSKNKSTESSYFSKV